VRKFQLVPQYTGMSEFGLLQTDRSMREPMNLPR